MYTTLATLIERLDSGRIADAAVINWGCPIPSFGDLESSRIATLGLNPSNREFVDVTGNELEGSLRRFHTLRSLGLESWSDAEARDLERIAKTCREYFSGNPYDRWFRKLDQILCGTGSSFYDAANPACHLDLIPYATECKWTALTTAQRAKLCMVSGDALALLLRDSDIRVLILNGRSVVEQFQYMANVSLCSRPMLQWSLPRKAADVPGIAYWGMTDELSGIGLSRDVMVLGYNHNIQSSYGVTAEAIAAIGFWIANSVEDVLR